MTNRKDFCNSVTFDGSAPKILKRSPIWFGMSKLAKICSSCVILPLLGLLNSSFTLSNDACTTSLNTKSYFSKKRLNPLNLTSASLLDTFEFKSSFILIKI